MSLRRALSFACIAAILAIASGIPPAAAQVRVARDPAALVDPSSGPLLRALFGRSGYFMVAGGVVLGGRANFLVEGNGTEMPLDVAAILPATTPEGAPAITYRGELYPIAMPAGLACPLAGFTARGGIVAYTVPKFLDEDSRMAMLRLGLRHFRVAHEFAGAPFEPLLRAADFAAAKPLPPALAQELSAGINAENGIGAFVLQVSAGSDKVIGSLINTDAQVTYRVHLMPQTHRLDIEGVPLRYYWQLDPSGGAAVFAVDELAQDWAPGTQLSPPGATPTQYDVVNFYQVSGLFRQLHQSHPAEFASFTAASCH